MDKNYIATIELRNGRIINCKTENKNKEECEEY